jgi:hypothetical protein
MARPTRRPTAEPSHVTTRRQEEDAARAERRAREDSLIQQHDRARKVMTEAEARRDADLAKLVRWPRTLPG